MKIAIVTYQRTASFGAVLQMVALQEAIQGMDGVDRCEVIDYANDAIEDVYKPFVKRDLKSLRGIAKTVLRYAAKKRTWDLFHNFIDSNVTITTRKLDCDLAGLEERYDAFVAGSDQIWHYGMNGHNSYYFLDFVKEQKKKYSYAASLGTGFIPEELKAHYKNWLSKFELISVREEEIVPDLEALTGRKVEEMPDPTFLHDVHYWDEKIKRVHHPNKYIIIYTVLEPLEIYQKAQELQKKTGYEVIVLNGKKAKVPKGFTCVHNITPYEFLDYIKQASAVLTNSFHASVFSLVFHKDFYVELEHVYVDGGGKHRLRNNRIENLLGKCKLEDRTLDKMGRGEPDWNAVDRALDVMRRKGNEYLHRISACAKGE